LIGTPIWFLQLVVLFKAMLFPGTIEVLFFYMAEFAFLAIMLMLIHPKFHAAGKNLLRGAGATLLAFVSFMFIFWPNAYKKTKLYGRLGWWGLIPGVGFVYYAGRALGHLWKGTGEFVSSNVHYLTNLVVELPQLLKQVPLVIEILHFQLLGRHWGLYKWWNEKRQKWAKREGLGRGGVLNFLLGPVPKKLEDDQPPRMVWAAAVVAEKNPRWTEHFRLFRVAFAWGGISLTVLHPAWALVFFLFYLFVSLVHMKLVFQEIVDKDK
jgi:hypothetical protein